MWTCRIEYHVLLLLSPFKIRAFFLLSLLVLFSAKQETMFRNFHEVMERNGTRPRFHELSHQTKKPCRRVHSKFVIIWNLLLMSLTVLCAVKLMNIPVNIWFINHNRSTISMPIGESYTIHDFSHASFIVVEMHSGTDSYLAWIARTLVVALSLFFFHLPVQILKLNSYLIANKVLSLCWLWCLFWWLIKN